VDVVNLEEEKQQLEIDKLKAELKYIPRNFVAQVVNTLGLAAVALVVFIFFQRPQIEQMEITRASTEKQEVAKLLLSAQAIRDPKDKRDMIQTLSSIYPQHEFVSQIAKSQNVLAEQSETEAVASSPSSQPTSESTVQPTPTPTSSSTPTSLPTPTPTSPTSSPSPSSTSSTSDSSEQRECASLNVRFNELQQQRADLLETLARETKGVGGSGKPGYGPVSRALDAQISTLDNAIYAVLTRMKYFNCVMPK